MIGQFFPEGTLGAFITHELYSMGQLQFGSAQSANFGGAIVAFRRRRRRHDRGLARHRAQA